MKHDNVQRLQFLEQARYRKPILLTIAVLIILGGAMTFFDSIASHPHPVIEGQPLIARDVAYAEERTDMQQIASRVEQGQIIISLTDVLNHRMVGFEYLGGLAPISLLAYISPQGKLVTSIAFCEPCNSKSYHGQNNMLICNVCGTTWKMENLEGISDRCQKFPPDPLSSIVVRDEILIDELKVKNWRTRI